MLTSLVRAQQLDGEIDEDTKVITEDMDDWTRLGDCLVMLGLADEEETAADAAPVAAGEVSFQRTLHHGIWQMYFGVTRHKIVRV